MPVSDDFAKGAMQALNLEEKAEETGEPAVGGEPAAAGGVADVVQALAAELAKQGATPEKAKEALDTLISLQTTEGQQNYYRQAIQSGALDPLKQQFGQEWVAAQLATPGGGERMFELMKSLGFKAETKAPVVEDDPDISPEMKEIRSLKAALAEQVAEQKRFREGTETQTKQVQRALSERRETEEKQGAFVQWANTKPAMAGKAVEAIAKRAFERSRTDQNYQGLQGFRRACDDVYAEYRELSPLFASPPRPRSIKTSGGGVSGAQAGFDPKVPFEDRAKGFGDDFAALVREGTGE